MLLTIETTHNPATDLGYLLFKHPNKVQTFSFSMGKAHVFYPIATPEKTRVALYVEVNPIELARRRGNRGQALSHYVNDRPYTACSLMSVALSRTFNKAMRGVCEDRPELARQKIPFEVKLPALPSRGGAEAIESLFAPLGYDIDMDLVPLDPNHPEWGKGVLYALCLRGEQTLKDLLTHLYVLIPVLDGQKHYWVGEAEWEKLLQKAGDWLPSHPARERITRRYLNRHGKLANDAVKILEANDDPQHQEEKTNAPEEPAKKRPKLNDARYSAVFGALKNLGVQSVLDLGCGEGKLLRVLHHEGKLTRLGGADVSVSCLERAHKKLKLDAHHCPVELWQSSVTYRDARRNDFEALCLIEVIEHMDASRLDALESSVFAPKTARVIVVTTPNHEYNALYDMKPGQLRHSDHRFEWDRNTFQTWARNIAARNAYQVSFRPVGPLHETLGAPTQMALFVKTNAS